MVLVLASCGSVEVPPSRFYRLEPAVLPAPSRPAELVLRVEGLSVAPHLAGDRLVAGIGPHRLEPYAFDLWAAPLDQLITDCVLRSLLDSGRFKAVLDERDRGQADVSLSGRVLSFEETARGTRFTGRAAIAFVLRDEHSGRVLWQGRLEDETAAPSDRADYVVWALNQSLVKVLTRFGTIAESKGDRWAACAAPRK